MHPAYSFSHILPQSACGIELLHLVRQTFLSASHFSKQGSDLVNSLIAVVTEDDDDKISSTIIIIIIADIIIFAVAIGGQLSCLCYTLLAYRGGFIKALRYAGKMLYGSY